MRRILLYLVTFVVLAGAAVGYSQSQVSSGGAFLPNDNYVLGGTWTWKGASPLVFEGATNDGLKTTLTVTDPTAARTWTVPDASDTVVGKATTDILTNKTLTAPAMTSPVITGKPTTYSTVTTLTGATDAIDISLGDVFMLSRAGAADAATLADPVAGDNGRIIRIMSGTSFAHTITITNGIGGAGATDDVITFTNRTSASITLIAHATKWYVVGANLAAIA
jgi:hypothetical protein